MFFVDYDPNSDVLIQQILDYIEEHLLDKLVLDGLEKTFFISRNVLNQMVRCVCNMTVTEYIRNRRLSLAACELRDTKEQIIHIAFKYNYETPEAFTKAFTRFYGFPPSFVRRSNPKLKQFRPFRIERFGGWENRCTYSSITKLTNLSESGQEIPVKSQYDKPIEFGGENVKNNPVCRYHIQLQKMKYKVNWSILIHLIKKLQMKKIDFKVDGKTTVFAHGLEFRLDKIHLTFQWKEEQKVLQFFDEKGPFIECYPGFRYFDTIFEGIKIRCMLYQVFEGMNALEYLYQNSDFVEVSGTYFHAQSLEFYYENNEQEDPLYMLVENYLKAKL